MDIVPRLPETSENSQSEPRTFRALIEPRQWISQHGRTLVLFFLPLAAYVSSPFKGKNPPEFLEHGAHVAVSVDPQDVSELLRGMGDTVHLGILGHVKPLTAKPSFPRL